MRIIPILGFFLLVALLAALLIVKIIPTQDETFTPEPLPVLILHTTNGAAAWDQKKLNGQITVLNFFASWCTPCEAEMPELVALKKKYPNIHLEGVAWNDEAGTLAKFLKKNGNPFGAVWIDPKGDATIALGINGIPETIIVDNKGMMRYRVKGPLTPALRASTVDPLIEQLLKENHAR